MPSPRRGAVSRAHDEPTETDSVPIFRRSHVHQNGNGSSAPTTAELRARREEEWNRLFPAAGDEEDYRRAFLRFSPLYWDIVQSTQQELLQVLLYRVPAELGVPAIFGLSVLYSRHGRPDDAARATLAMIVNELPAPHARALIVALADAWQNAERSAYEERGRQVADEFARALRRLEGTVADADGTVLAIEEQVALAWDGAGARRR